MGIVAAPTSSRVPVATTAWIRGPFTDGVVAFAWLPVYVAGVLADAAALRDLTLAVLLVSFCHQPVTLPLIYGDAVERRRLAAIVVVAPPLAVATVYIGLDLSLVLVGVVSGLWNAHHTLRQRYGLVRVYGRKVGQHDGRHEQDLLFAWFLFVLLLCVAGDSLVATLEGLPVGFLNLEIVDLLASIQPVAPLLAAPVLAWATVTTWRWWQLERDRPQNRAKHLYLVGAGAGFAVAPFDPVAGFLAFMAAHSIEYLVVVAGTVRRRVPERSLVGRAVAVPGGPVLFLAGWVVAVLAAIALARTRMPAQLFVACYLAIGVLHFVFDGMIWRLRRAAVADTFQIR